MLYVVALILLVLWLTGMLTSYTMGGLIHIVLLIAVAAIVVRLARGQNAFVSMKQPGESTPPENIANKS